MNSFEFDVVVIGSGFGGAVSACRLAEHGMKVLVLERGRRWSPENYPRDPGDPWLWQEETPGHFNGWADLRTFSNMWVAAGAGVGGGSLIYANISVEAKPQVFDRGWPKDIHAAELAPYYGRVGRMLDVQEVPDHQSNERMRMMREAAEACGWGDRFRKLPMAVHFDPDWHEGLPDPRNPRHSKTWINPYGKTQGTCVHCGDCDIGCSVQAKNTLDLNYLAVAERHDAQIRPLHRVTCIEPCGSGYKVHFDVIDPVRHELTPGNVTAQRVVLGAGSIGSTELLLRCRDQHRTLPALSRRLGKGWAFNGDFVTPTLFKNRKVSPTHGPVISAAIDLLDGSVDGQALFIEDGGVPNLAADFVKRRIQGAPKRGKLRHFWRDLGKLIDADDPLENMMPWFGQGIDAADGELFLGRLWYAPWRRVLRMNWDYRRSERMVEAMVGVHKRLSASLGGEPFVPPTWTLLRNLITPHPLGGCAMADSEASGVVNSYGEVFGHPNLYVMDGATLPRAIGINPSRTIAALAERSSQRLCASA